MRTLPSITVVLLGIGASVAPAWPQARPTYAELERVAREELASSHTPGAVVGIVRDGKLTYVRGFGVANVETGAPMTADMLFMIGSTTKMFTAAALLTLAGAGKIDLDAGVRRYVGGLDSVVGAVTSRQLLSHTAGLADGYRAVGASDDSALARTVRSYDGRDFFAAPGAIFSYSNPGFVLAGAVAEAANGRPYGKTIEALLLQPLGMTRSTFDLGVAMTYPRAEGHELDDQGSPRVVRPVRSHQGTWPSGSLWTNVAGLARFAAALMDSGRVDGRQVLSSSVVAAMSGSHSGAPFARYRVNNFAFDNMSYGYGAILYEVRGTRIVGHNGDVPGYGSLFRVIPSRRAAVIVLTNRSGLWLNRTAETAMGVVGPLGPAEPAAEPIVAMTPAEMATYAGTYESPGQRSVTLEVTDGRLTYVTAEVRSVVLKLGDLRFVRLPPDVAVRARGTLPPADATGFGWPEFLLVRGPGAAIGYLHSQARALRRR